MYNLIMYKKEMFDDLADNFDYISLKLREIQKKIIKESGIDVTHKQYIYARLIERLPGCTSVQLLKYVSVTKGTFSTQLKALNKKGFIKFVIDESNKKEKAVYLTKKGQELVNLKNKIEQAIETKFKMHFNNEELESMLSISKKIVEITK